MHQAVRMEDNVEDEELFEVECFLNTRKMSDGIRYYKVRWKGYPPEEDSWEPEGNVKECTEALDAFWSKRQKKKNKKRQNVNEKAPQPSSSPEVLPDIIDKPLGLTRQATKEIHKARINQHKQTELSPSSHTKVNVMTSSEVNVMTSSEDLSSGVDSCDIITVNSPPGSDRNTDVETIEIMSQGSTSDDDQVRRIGATKVPPVISLLSDSESDHAKEECETPDIQSPEIPKITFSLSSLSNIKDNEVPESNSSGHTTEGTGNLTTEIPKNKFVGHTKEGFEIPELPSISENSSEYTREGFEIPKEYFIASSSSATTKQPEFLENLQTGSNTEEGRTTPKFSDESLPSGDKIEVESDEKVTDSVCLDQNGVEIPQVEISCTSKPEKSSTADITQEVGNFSINDTNEPGLQSPTFERQTFAPKDSQLLVEDQTTPQSFPLKHTGTPKSEVPGDSSVDPSSSDSTPRSKKRFNLSLQKKNRRKKYEYLEAQSTSSDKQESEIKNEKDQAKPMFNLEDLREQMALMTNDSNGKLGNSESTSHVDRSISPQVAEIGKRSATVEELKELMLNLANEREKEKLHSIDQSGPVSSSSVTQIPISETPTVSSSETVAHLPSSESSMDLEADEVATQPSQTTDDSILLTENIESSQEDTIIQQDTMKSEGVVSGSERLSFEASEGVVELEKASQIGTTIKQIGESMDVEVAVSKSIPESSEEIVAQEISKNDRVEQNIETMEDVLSEEEELACANRPETSQKSVELGKGSQLDTLVQRDTEPIDMEVIVSETEEITFETTPETSNDGIKLVKSSQMETFVQRDTEPLHTKVIVSETEELENTPETSKNGIELGKGSQVNTFVQRDTEPLHTNVIVSETEELTFETTPETSKDGIELGKGSQVNTFVQRNTEPLHTKVIVSQTDDIKFGNTSDTSKDIGMELENGSQINTVQQNTETTQDVEVMVSETEVVTSVNTPEACQEVAEEDLSKVTDYKVLQIDESNETYQQIIENDDFKPLQKLDTVTSKLKCDKKTGDTLVQADVNETAILYKEDNVVEISLKDIQAEVSGSETGLDGDITDTNTNNDKVKSDTFEAGESSEQVNKDSLSHGKTKVLQKLKSFAAKIKQLPSLSRSNSVVSNVSVSSDDGRLDLGKTVNVKDYGKMNDINDQNTVESSSAGKDDCSVGEQSDGKVIGNFIKAPHSEKMTEISILEPNTTFSRDVITEAEYKQKETTDVKSFKIGENAGSSSNDAIGDTIITLLVSEKETAGEESGKRDIEDMQIEENVEVGSDKVSNILTLRSFVESHLEKVNSNISVESPNFVTSTDSNSVTEISKSRNDEPRQNTEQMKDESVLQIHAVASSTNTENTQTITKKKKKKIMKKARPKELNKGKDNKDVVKENSGMYTEVKATEGTLDSPDIIEIPCDLQDSSSKQHSNELNNNSKAKLKQTKKRLSSSSPVIPNKKKKTSLNNNNKQREKKASQKQTTVNKQRQDTKKTTQQTMTDKSTSVSVDDDAPPDLDSGDLIGKILDEGDMVDNGPRSTKSVQDKKATDPNKNGDGATADEEDELHLDLDEFPIEILLDDEISELKDIPSPPVTPIEVTYGDLKQFIRDGDEMSVRAALKGGTELNVLDGASGMTLLMLASAACQDNIVELLLRRQADVNAVQKNGMTALMHACEQGCPETAHLLLMCGADINKQQIAGETALMKACKKGHTDVVELLLNHGASTKLETKSGQTACQLALQVPNPCEEIQVLLEEHEKRLSKAIEQAITTCLGESVTLSKPPILAYRCVAPREGQQFTYPFQYSPTQQSTVKKDVILFCIKANFTDDAMSLLFGEDNGVRGVLLNGKSQIPLLQGVRSIFSIEPKKGSNKVTIQTHKSSDRSKLIICIYSIQAS